MSLREFGSHSSPHIDHERDLLDEIDGLRAALDDIRGHMGACIVQRAASDDAIIFDHIEDAHRIAGAALRARK